MWATGPMFVTRRQVPGNFEFAAFADSVEHISSFSLDVTNKVGTDPQEFLIYCIPTSLLSTSLGDPVVLNLSERKTQKPGEWRLFDGSDGRYGRAEDDCTAPQTGSADLRDFFAEIALSSAPAIRLNS